MDAVFRIRFWETGDWASIGHTRIYSSPSPELLQTLFSCWAALLVLDPKHGKEAELLATSLCFLITCGCGTEEFGMIWFFPWSTGRCHNCFGKKNKNKSQEAILLPQAHMYTDTNSRCGNPDHILCHCKRGCTSHFQPTDSEDWTQVVEHMWIYWHSIASPCLCDFWKQSVFSQDILITSLPRYIFYRRARTCCKIYL